MEPGLIIITGLLPRLFGKVNVALLKIPQRIYVLRIFHLFLFFLPNRRAIGTFKERNGPDSI